MDNCQYGSGIGQGISYEVDGGMIIGGVVRKKSESRVNSFTLVNNFRSRGMRPGPSRIQIIHDQDDQLPLVPGSINNTPDPTDNHGIAGQNVIYCDGHAAWLSREQFIDAYNISNDDNRPPLP
jgi:hypothetical protein